MMLETGSATPEIKRAARDLAQRMMAQAIGGPAVVIPAALAIATATFILQIGGDQIDADSIAQMVRNIIEDNQGIADRRKH